MAPRALSMAVPAKNRVVAVTSSGNAGSVGRRSSAVPAGATTIAWGVAPKSRVLISASKPFITLATTVSVITARARAVNEAQLTNVAWALRRANK